MMNEAQASLDKGVAKGSTAPGASLLLFRLPWPGWVTAVALVVYVAAEQVLEELLLSGDITGQRLLYRTVLVALVLYLLLVLLLLKRRMLLTLPKLKNAVVVEAEVFDRYALRLVKTSRLRELGSLLAALATVVLLFLVLRAPLPLGGELAMAPSVVLAPVILATYVVVGWLGLSLVQMAVQHAFALRRLAAMKLEINVYDPDNLLPFGTTSLQHSLALLGVIVILIIPLGLPTGPSGWLVVSLASSASLASLLLPIWPVYSKTRSAKEEALSEISRGLLWVQESLAGRGDGRVESVADLNARANALVNLRKTIQDVPNWPFRSTATLVRAITAALSPLIYFVLIELMRAYFVPLFVR